MESMERETALSRECVCEFRSALERGPDSAGERARALPPRERGRVCWERYLITGGQGGGEMHMGRQHTQKG